MPVFSSHLVIFLIMIVNVFSCGKRSSEDANFYDSDLFRDVQLAQVFPDSKTFVDCIPKRTIHDILSDYQINKDHNDFNLDNFVHENFHLPVRPDSKFLTDSSLTMGEHISSLWPVLTRQADEKEEESSLIPLPYNYVVPGGRFSEIYYWDSYFTMLGLKAQGHNELVENMVKNFAYLIESIGFIPNGNRDYYLTRSQPPFFSLMVEELEEIDSLALIKYLPALEKEYSFWMNGMDSVVKPGDASQHVVMMPDGTIMNRYWDKDDSPRPESFREDYLLAAHEENPEALYRNIRSAAESGWDFSSRWLEDNNNSLSSIQTIEIIPVDLNCLLANLERTIARGYLMKGEPEKARIYSQRVDQRRRALLTFFWDPETNFFYDYDFVKQRKKQVRSLAAVFPLFFKMTSKDVADKLAVQLQRDFLKPGGMITTLIDTDQQWDAPNGWPPLQWMTFKSMVNYEHYEFAEKIRSRWLRLNERVFQSTGKMMEKYNVLDTTLIAGGGEYPNQDGFGWTNGVVLAFLYQRPAEEL